MVVRAVEIHQRIAEVPQKGERAGRAVHKLFARAFAQHRALDDESPILAGLRAGFFEEPVNWRRSGNLEKPLDGAGIGSAANKRAVGAFAQEQLHRAEDDGFSRARLASDGHETSGGFPKEILDKCEVADAKGCQRCGHRGTMPRSARISKRCRTFRSHF